MAAVVILSSFFVVTPCDPLNPAPFFRSVELRVSVDAAIQHGTQSTEFISQLTPRAARSEINRLLSLYQGSLEKQANHKL
jgi:hypothetical protein